MPGFLSNLAPLLIVVFLGIGMAGVLGTIAGHVYGRVTHRWPFGNGDATNEFRHCRYCYFGRSELQAESARIEGDELVEVKCFVCGSCGLPQWSVQRSTVLKRAA